MAANNLVTKNDFNQAINRLEINISKLPWTIVRYMSLVLGVFLITAKILQILKIL